MSTQAQPRGWELRVPRIFIYLLAALFVTVIAMGWRYITTDHAVYELETGEYLHCTPEDGNTLTCEVTHRKDNQ